MHRMQPPSLSKPPEMVGGFVFSVALRLPPESSTDELNPTQKPICHQYFWVINDVHFDRLLTILNDSSLFPGAAIMSTEPWVTALDVAQHLGVAKDTVYRWRERKGLPAHKIGRLWKFQLSEVDEWVRAGGADEEQQKQD